MKPNHSQFHTPPTPPQALSHQQQRHHPSISRVNALSPPPAAAAAANTTTSSLPFNIEKDLLEAKPRNIRNDAICANRKHMHHLKNGASLSMRHSRFLGNNTDSAVGMTTSVGGNPQQANKWHVSHLHRHIRQSGGVSSSPQQPLAKKHFNNKDYLLHVKINGKEEFLWHHDERIRRSSRHHHHSLKKQSPAGGRRNGGIRPDHNSATAKTTTNSSSLGKSSNNGKTTTVVSSGQHHYHNAASATDRRSVTPEQQVRIQSGKRYSSTIYERIPQQHDPYAADSSLQHQQHPHDYLHQNDSSLQQEYNYEPPPREFLLSEMASKVGTTSITPPSLFSSPSKSKRRHSHSHKRSSSSFSRRTPSPIKRNNLTFQGARSSSSHSERIMNVNETRLLRAPGMARDSPQKNINSSPAAGDNPRSSSVTLPLNMSNGLRRHSEKVKNQEQMYRAWRLYRENSNRRVQEMRERLSKEEWERYWKNEDPDELSQTAEGEGASPIHSLPQGDLSHVSGAQGEGTSPLPRRQSVSVLTVDPSNLPNSPTNELQNASPSRKSVSLAPQRVLRRSSVSASVSPSESKSKRSFWNSSARRASTPTLSKKKKRNSDKKRRLSSASAASQQRDASSKDGHLPHLVDHSHLPPRPVSQASVTRRKRPIAKNSSDPMHHETPAEQNLQMVSDENLERRSSSAPLVKQDSEPVHNNNNHSRGKKKTNRRRKRGSKSRLSLASNSMPISERSNLRSRGPGAYYKKWTGGGSKHQVKYDLTEEEVTLGRWEAG